MADELSAEEREAIAAARQENGYKTFATYMSRFLEENKKVDPPADPPADPPKKTTPPEGGFFSTLFGG